MKPEDPGFMVAVAIEHAKKLLDDAIQRLENKEPGNAFVSINTALKELLKTQQDLLGQANREFHRAAKHMEKSSDD